MSGKDSGLGKPGVFKPIRTKPLVLPQYAISVWNECKSALAEAENRVVASGAGHAVPAVLLAATRASPRRAPVSNKTEGTQG